MPNLYDGYLLLPTPLPRLAVDRRCWRNTLTYLARQYLWFPCGVVRGALSAMGINATVQAETNELPGAVFQIKTVPAKA